MGYNYYRSRTLYNLVGDNATGDYDWVSEVYNYNLNPTSRHDYPHEATSAVAHAVFQRAVLTKTIKM
jgi:hypothetical protein